MCIFFKTKHNIKNGRGWKGSHVRVMTVGCLCKLVVVVWLYLMCLIDGCSREEEILGCGC